MSVTNVITIKSILVYTLAGGKFRIKDTTGVREVDIPTGYDFYNEKVEWHEVLNIGETTAVFLIVEPK